MRRLLYTMLLLVAVVATGCKKEKPVENLTAKLYGEWHCEAEAFSAEVYVAFNEDGSFDLYQLVGEGRYRYYDGTWGVRNDTLFGIYSDESPWGSDYRIGIVDAETMTLTALNGSEEMMTYRRTTIPATVKDESTTLRSTTNEDTHLWF